MKVLAFNSSPRKEKGVSDIVMNLFLEGAEEAGAETEKHYVTDLDIKGCLGCFTCWTETPGRCVHRDDMDWIIPRWGEADVIFLGTPIYNYNIVHYLQSIEKEVNLPACEKYGVDVTRRITGGGAVYHDYDGEITYSIVAPEADPKMPADILESYELICGAIVNGLAGLGVDAEFKPVNDIVAGGKKISGNAQTRRHGVILQHGTILVDSDIRRMFQVLRVSDAKISDKLIQAVEVFGDGNVGSNLIVGLGETEREAAELIQRLHDMKVKTVLFAFTPLAGTRLEDLPPPQMEKYRRLQAARHLIVNGYAALEDLSFDEDGRITGYGGEDLDTVLGDGVAFMTTGCPGCNRPFYNERPSGPFYNYPRPLTEDEIKEELAALKTQ